MQIFNGDRLIQIFKWPQKPYLLNTLPWTFIPKYTNSNNSTITFNKFLIRQFKKKNQLNNLFTVEKEEGFLFKK